jgi:hypothetical protein
MKDSESDLDYKGLFYEFGFNSILVVYGFYMSVVIEMKGKEKTFDDFLVPLSENMVLFVGTFKQISMITVQLF